MTAPTCQKPSYSLTGQYVDHINGSIDLVEEKINLEQISIVSGSNDLLINGSVSNLAYLFSSEDVPIAGFLDLQAGKLELYKFISPDSLLFSPGNNVFENLELKLKVNTSSGELKEPGWFPDGEFSIEKLTARLNYLPDPFQYSGNFTIREEMVAEGENMSLLENYYLGIRDMNIRSGDNDLSINGVLTSQINPEDPGTSPVSGNLSLRSNRLALSTLFAYDTILAGSYKEILSDADIRLSYQTSLKNLAENWYLTRGEISLDHFSVKLKNRANISETSGTLIVSDNRITFEDLKGVYGNSDIAFSAHVNNYPGFWLTDSLVEIDIGFSARSDLMRADDFFTYKNNFYLIGKYRGESLEDFALSANFHYLIQDLFGARILPDASIEITELQWRTSYDQLFFRDFHLALVREGKDLELKDFKGKIGESDFAFRAYLKNFTPFTDPDLTDFSADLNTQDPEDVVMNSEVSVKNIQVDRILLNFRLKDEDISPGEYFKGDLSVSAFSEVHLDPDFKINLAQSGGTLDFALKEGQIQDYPPMQELAKYFRDKDLDNVKFESSVDGIKVDKGTIKIPRMAVNSTLGHLYFTGTYDPDEGVEYIFEVPFRLVASTAWGMLVRRSREEDALEDEIQTPSRGAYVTLRLLSNEEGGYDMKLGKGKREKRRAERRERRERREGGRTSP